MNGLLRYTLIGMMVAQTAYAQDDTQLDNMLPAATTIGSINYLSGGIGLDQSVAMKLAAPSYPLELVFVVKAGMREQYTSDIDVKVSDRSGKVVVDTVSNGPFLLANLPDGNYQIEAINDGILKIQQVVVKKGVHRRVVFAWTE
jgi:hypothetical protein